MIKAKRHYIRGIFFLIIGGIYISNPGAGIIELLPDNLPLIGNLDEGVSGVVILQGLTDIGFIDWMKR